MSSNKDKFLAFFQSINSIAQDEDPKAYFNGAIKKYEKLKENFKGGEMEEAASEFKKELEEMENTELHIAITGETGSGKSTFINALRGLKAEDDDAAPVGVTETTLEPKAYSHPNYLKVKFWDLPGIGSQRYTPENYLKEVGYSKYDFFIILGSTRFQHYHIQLAEEIQRMDKLFYFVRSKMDIDMSNEKRDHPKTSEDQAIKKIRDDCNKNLQQFKDGSHQSFLISSLDLAKYDFPHLVETLEKDLPNLKRRAFLLSLPNYSSDVIEMKKSELKSHLWKISLVCAAINVFPIPDLPLPCDIPHLHESMVDFYKRFELDDGSLCRLAGLARIPVEELKAVMKSPRMEEITVDLVIMKIGNFLTTFIPDLLVRSLARAGLSFAITYWMLSSFIDNLAEDAEKVRKKALETRALDRAPRQGQDMMKPKICVPPKEVVCPFCYGWPRVASSGLDPVALGDGRGSGVHFVCCRRCGAWRRVAAGSFRAAAPPVRWGTRVCTFSCMGFSLAGHVQHCFIVVHLCVRSMLSLPHFGFVHMRSGHC